MAPQESVCPQAGCRGWSGPSPPRGCRTLGLPIPDQGRNRPGPTTLEEASSSSLATLAEFNFRRPLSRHGPAPVRQRDRRPTPDHPATVVGPPVALAMGTRECRDRGGSPPPSRLSAGQSRFVVSDLPLHRRRRVPGRTAGHGPFGHVVGGLWRHHRNPSVSAEHTAVPVVASFGERIGQGERLRWGYHLGELRDHALYRGRHASPRCLAGRPPLVARPPELNGRQNREPLFCQSTKDGPAPYGFGGAGGPKAVERRGSRSARRRGGIHGRAGGLTEGSRLDLGEMERPHEIVSLLVNDGHTMKISVLRALRDADVGRDLGLTLLAIDHNRPIVLLPRTCRHGILKPRD